LPNSRSVTSDSDPTAIAEAARDNNLPTDAGPEPAA